RASQAPRTERPASRAPRRLSYSAAERLPRPIRPEQRPARSTDASWSPRTTAEARPTHPSDAAAPSEPPESESAYAPTWSTPAGPGTPWPPRRPPPLPGRPPARIHSAPSSQVARVPARYLHGSLSVQWPASVHRLPAFQRPGRRSCSRTSWRSAAVDPAEVAQRLKRQEESRTRARVQRLPLVSTLPRP